MCQAERVRRREVVDRAASSGFNAYADDVVPMEALGSAYRRLARHDRFGGAVKAGARCAILLCSRKCATSRPVLVTETSRNRIEAAMEALGSAYCRLATHDRLGGAVKANGYGLQQCNNLSLMVREHFKRHSRRLATEALATRYRLSGSVEVSARCGLQSFKLLPRCL